MKRKLEGDLSQPLKEMSAMIKEHGNPNQLIKQYKKISKSKEAKALLKATKSSSLKEQIAKLADLYNQREQIAIALTDSSNRTAQFFPLWVIKFFKFAISSKLAFTVSLIGTVIVCVAILGCTYALADWALTYVDNFVLTVSEGLFIKLPTFLIKYLFKGLLTVGELVDKLLIFIFGSEEGK
jgi:hypothetical protein